MDTPSQPTPSPSGRGKRGKSSPPPSSAPTAPNVPTRSPVTLIKGAHRWSFQCDPGDEGVLLRRLSELAGQIDTPFDWFDAALVSHQLNKRLKPGLHRIDGQSQERA